MKIPGTGRIKQIARMLRTRISPGAVILAYHRVSELGSDPQCLSVRPRNFEKHLSCLQAVANVVSLSTLCGFVRDRKIPPRTVAITFDDGYADNLHLAKPIIEQYEKSATVFITSGFMACDHEFWWDDLERMFLQPGKLPAKLVIDVRGQTHAWDLGDAENYSNVFFGHYKSWNVCMRATPTTRHRIYRELSALICRLRSEEQRVILDRITAWASLPRIVRPSHRAMSAAEVKQLSQGGAIEIGAHTVSHCALSTLVLGEQERELTQSKKDLENIVGQAVDNVAYPFGTVSDFSEDTARLVQKAGFASACSTTADIVWRNSDLFSLPRFLVRDWTGEEFRASLEKWFHWPRD